MAELDRRLLPERLAETLEQEITGGVWKERLPGYRVLCQRYGVSRPTCEDALRILEKRGLLAPPEPRRTRRIIAQQVEGDWARSRHLLVVTDRMHCNGEVYRQVIDPIVSSWITQKGKTSSVEADFGRSKRPDSLLGRWIGDAGADVLLLHMPSRFWLQAAKRSGLPCFSIGGDTVEFRDWIAGSGFALFRFLGALLNDAFQMGHRRILIPFSGMLGEPAFRDTLLSEVKEILKEYGIDDELTLSVEAPQASIPSDWHAWWPNILVRMKPSLVILRDISEAFSFHSFCLKNRIRMPEDISMVSVHDSPIMGWLDPPPTRYAFPHAKEVRHFQAWVRREFPTGYWKNFSSEFVGGETLGPGRGSRKG